jgi:hypothetical protein
MWRVPSCHGRSNTTDIEEYSYNHCCNGKALSIVQIYANRARSIRLGCTAACRLIMRHCIPPSPNLDHSSVRPQVTPRPQDARAPSSERWNFVERKLSGSFSPTMPTSTVHRRDLLHVANLATWYRTALLPLRRKAFWGFFFRTENPTASAGFETAKLGF